MRYIVMDFAGKSTKEGIQETIRASLNAPEYYGNNLDALYDVLTSQKEDVIIDIDGIDEVAEDIKDYVQKVFDVIKDAAEATKNNVSGKVISVDAMGEDEE